MQNPRHKCDLGNKNDSVTDKEITADNIWLQFPKTYFELTVNTHTHYYLSPRSEPIIPRTLPNILFWISQNSILLFLMNSPIILLKFPKLTYMYIVSGGFNCTLCFLEISKGLGHLNRLHDYLSRPFFPTFATVCHVAIILTQLFLKLFLFWEASIILLIILEL